MKKILFLLAFTLIAHSSATRAEEPAPPAAITPPAAAIPPAATVEEDPEQEAYAAIARLISNQIRPCWKIPAKNTDALEANIDIDPQGNLAFVDFSTELKPGQKQLAESIKDAIANPNCNPIKTLPPKELYYIWQKIALLFSPKK